MNDRDRESTESLATEIVSLMTALDASLTREARALLLAESLCYHGSNVGFGALALLTLEAVRKPL